MAQRQDLAQDQRGQDTSQLLDALSHLIRTARAASHREPAEYGLSGTPLGILKTLASGDARPGDLAARLQIAPSVVSRAVVPLERAGLVARRTDPVAGRAARLGLPAAGRQRLEEARQDVADRFTPLLDDWDPADVRTLTPLLTRLRGDPRGGGGPSGH